MLEIDPLDIGRIIGFISSSLAESVHTPATCRFLHPTLTSNKCSDDFHLGETQLVMVWYPKFDNQGYRHDETETATSGIPSKHEPNTLQVKLRQPPA